MHSEGWSPFDIIFLAHDLLLAFMFRLMPMPLLVGIMLPPWGIAIYMHSKLAHDSQTMLKSVNVRIKLKWIMTNFMHPWK
jgi:hypothetical protein